MKKKWVIEGKVISEAVCGDCNSEYDYIMDVTDGGGEFLSYALDELYGKTVRVTVELIEEEEG